MPAEGEMTALVECVGPKAAGSTTARGVYFVECSITRPPCLQTSGDTNGKSSADHAGGLVGGGVVQWIPDPCRSANREESIPLFEPGITSLRRPMISSAVDPIALTIRPPWLVTFGTDTQPADDR